MSRIRDLYENVERSAMEKPPLGESTPVSRWAREVTDHLESALGWAKTTNDMLTRLVALSEKQNEALAALNARITFLEGRD